MYVNLNFCNYITINPYRKGENCDHFCQVESCWWRGAESHGCGVFNDCVSAHYSQANLALFIAPKFVWFGLVFKPFLFPCVNRFFFFLTFLFQNINIFKQYTIMMITELSLNNKMYNGQEMWQIETHTHTHTGVLFTKAKLAIYKASVLEKYENASTDVGYVCLGIGH